MDRNTKKPQPMGLRPGFPFFYVPFKDTWRVHVCLTGTLAHTLFFLTGSLVKVYTNSGWLVALGVNPAVRLIVVPETEEKKVSCQGHK